MIEWEKTSHLNGMSVKECKIYFDKYPNSDKKLFRYVMVLIVVENRQLVKYVVINYVNRVPISVEVTRMKPKRS